MRLLLLFFALAMVVAANREAWGSLLRRKRDIQLPPFRKHFGVQVPAPEAEFEKAHEYRLLKNDPEAAERHPPDRFGENMGHNRPRPLRLVERPSKEEHLEQKYKYMKYRTL